MKTIELLERSDLSAGISRSDMELVFNAAKKKELDKDEVIELSNDLVDSGYSRTSGSAKFVIDRMHTIIYGKGPDGYTQKQEENMMVPSGTIKKFLSDKGIDVGDRIKRAKINMKNRIRKLSQSDATKLMSEYGKSILQTLSNKKKKWLKTHREQIIGDIMSGDTPKDAYNKVLTS